MFQKLIGPKVSSLETAIAELESEWLPCARRRSLVELIEKEILPNPRIEIDSALCLGLGSFSKRLRRWWHFPCRLRSKSNDEENIAKRLRVWDYEYDISSLPEDEDEGHDCSTDDEDNRYGVLSNISLYELLLFETVIERLRSRSNIRYSLIQDPSFTASDRAFLTKRGHTVILYPSRSVLAPTGDGYPLDPSLLARISNKTFFFAPGLDIPVSVDVILAAKPSLIWGYDVCLDIGYPYFLNPLSRGYPLVDSYAALARSYAFIRAPICDCSSPNDGFMYPVDTSDPEALIKVQQRVERANAEAEKTRPWILQIVEENRLKQEPGKRKWRTNRSCKVDESPR
ncbi:hypothetical protein MMC30_008890 [Trapelia coarctata]|nr:hypothetical protein [Trapelia coarctata]